MKWTPWLLGSFTVVLMAGCGGERRNNDTGTAGGAETETGTMQGGTGTATDTTFRTDTTGTATQRDSVSGNQTKSGVTDTRTGKSTLGEGATQTRPDQGQPVTSKGDTIKSGAENQ